MHFSECFKELMLTTDEHYQEIVNKTKYRIKTNTTNYNDAWLNDFNSFRPILLKNTAFIYNVGQHWVIMSNFNPNHQIVSSVWFICDSMYKVRRSIYQKLFKKLLPQEDSVMI
jgi:hypothetical protein